MSTAAVRRPSTTLADGRELIYSDAFEPCDWISVAAGRAFVLPTRLCEVMPRRREQ